jgi:hypothetical protein
MLKCLFFYTKMYKKIVADIVLNMLKDGGSQPKRLNMDMTQEIISKLKFIGKLKKGEKINTRHMYVQPTGFGTTISRTFFNQDNRGNALSFCQETLSRAFELTITYERSTIPTDKVLFTNIVKDLQDATTGLVNLKYTYIGDTKFCCDMDTLLQSINAKLSTYLTTPLITQVEHSDELQH